MAVDPLLIFDPDYYRAVNPDLAGLDDVQAYVHFRNLGLDEGRKFSRFIDLDEYPLIYFALKNSGKSSRFSHIIKTLINNNFRVSRYIDGMGFYRQVNPDLAHLNNEEAFKHLIEFGIAEGRLFSSHIDILYYKSVNPDLAELSNQQAFEHLIDIGISEGRIFSPYIDIPYYKSVNPDLAHLSNDRAFQHLVFFADKEGRRFAPPLAIAGESPNNGNSLVGENPLAEPSSIDLSGIQILQGGRLRDLLVGDTRDEFISGEEEQDVLIGSGGSDIFVIDAALATSETEKIDFIVDFDKAMGDRLGLRGNISAADLTFARVRLKTEDLEDLGEVIKLLHSTGISFEEIRERLSNGESLGIVQTLLQVRGMNRESLEALFSSGVTPASLDPNGDDIIEATAISINGGLTLAFALNTNPADLSGNIISLL